MRVEKIEVPASVRIGMEKPLGYLFARADRGGAGWIGRLDAPKGETFGGIMFYAMGRVLHVLALAETAQLYPICRWTCGLPDGWADMIAYMPPATAYCARDTAYRISIQDGDAFMMGWWCRVFLPTGKEWRPKNEICCCGGGWDMTSPVGGWIGWWVLV